MVVISAVGCQFSSFVWSSSSVISCGLLLLLTLTGLELRHSSFELGKLHRNGAESFISAVTVKARSLEKATALSSNGQEWTVSTVTNFWYLF